MILLIDNYDSFSYNLYQLIGSVNPDIQVVRNDEISLGEIEKLVPEAIVLSPGPGRPEEAGICKLYPIDASILWIGINRIYCRTFWDIIRKLSFDIEISIT